MGVKQAVEDFIEAHEGEIATPIAVTARMEDAVQQHQSGGGRKVTFTSQHGEAGLAALKSG